MRRLLSGTKTILFALCALLFAAASMSAADAVIRGVVTDDAGKPVRGALVKVSVERSMTMNRFSQKDGSFEVTVPAGTYTVTVDAYGFGLARKQADTTQGGTLSFKLAPGADMARMSGAELETLLPNTREGEIVKDCNQCHGFTIPMRHAGWMAKDWAEFLPHMNTGKLGVCVQCGNPGTMPALSHALETIFGPDGMWGPDAAPPDLTKVKRTEMQDGALKASIKEWTIPTPSMVHSVSVDPRSGMIWFGEYDILSNKVGRFDPETEKFTEYPIPVPKSRPHTGTVAADGTYIVTLASGGHSKLAAVDKDGKMSIYDNGDSKASTHTARADVTGRTIWVTAGGETWSWDLETKKVTASFKNPVPETFPEGSKAARDNKLFEGAGQRLTGSGYDVDSDSKGIVWISELENGMIVRLDPKTGAMKTYHTPEMMSARGIAVDAQDNVWWGDYYGHKLGHLDTKTGAIKLYQPPTPIASPYGVTVDKKRGYVWFNDTLGNQVTRFDPKTEQFLEYPLPTRLAAVRFNGVDLQGHLWYSGYFNGKLGVIDPDGAIKPMSSQR